MDVRKFVLFGVGIWYGMSIAKAEVVDPPGVKPLNQTFAVRQGYRELSVHSGPEACELEAQRLTPNAGLAVRSFLVKTGGGAVVSTSSSLAECLTATQQRLAAIGETQTSGANVNRCEASTKYSTEFQPPVCVATYNYTARYQPPTTPPPPVCPSPPSGRVAECTNGTYGTWWQTATIGPAPACTVTWSDAPSGTCKPIPTCDCPTPGTALLSWRPPTHSTDGVALTDLAGYYIVYGTSAENLDRQIIVSNPAVSRYTVTGLEAGSWYFVVKAFTASFAEVSGPSNMVLKVVR